MLSGAAKEPVPSVVAFPKGQVRLINNDHFTCHARCILPTYGINFRNAQAPSGCKPQVKPLEQRRKKSSKRTRSGANEGTGNNVTRKVHAAENAANREHTGRDQQHDGNGHTGHEPTCRNGEGREGMPTRKRLTRAIASNERRDGAALVGPRRIEPPPEETHCDEPHGGDADEGNQPPRIAHAGPPEQQSIDHLEHYHDAAVDDVERPNNARAAPQGSRPLLIALLVMLFAACLIRSHRCRFLLLKIASQSVQRRNAR